MRVPWTARRSNQSILKEISPGCSLEGLMLKLKLLLWPSDAKSQLIGHESEQTLGDSKEQGILAGCISRGHEESDKT